MINIAIVDDHKIFLDAIENYLNRVDDFNAVYATTSASDFLDHLKVNTEHVDIVLLDIKMKGLSGLECLEILKQEYPAIKVIMVSMFHESQFINEAIQLGAMSFIPKDIESEILIEAIYSVHENGFYAYEHLSKYLTENLEEHQKNKDFIDPVNRITKSEFQVLQYICQGYTAQKIGDKLFKSKRTIEGHKHRLLAKTNLSNTAALVAWAFREGLVV